MIFAEVKKNYLLDQYIFIKLWNCLPFIALMCVHTQDHGEATGPCCHLTLPLHVCTLSGPRRGYCPCCYLTSPSPVNMSPIVLHCFVYTLIGLLVVLQCYFSPNVTFFCCCPLQFLTILIYPFK